MKILLVGGTWDFNNGKASKLVDSVYDCIGQYIIKNCLDIDIEFYKFWDSWILRNRTILDEHQVH